MGFGAIGGFSFGGLANLRQAGMPGCLSEALYQLTQSERSQEGSGCPCKERAPRGERGGFDRGAGTLQLFPLPRALQSLNDVMPFLESLHPRAPSDSDLRCSTEWNA